MASKTYYVYIMSNKSRRLYVGITSRLAARVCEHRNKVNKGFTARYNFDVLVYYEEFLYVLEAIAREKEIKGWLREKKLTLILSLNPNWADLSQEWEEDLSWQAIPEARPVLKRKLGDP
jgi:putative endonuclease